MPSADLPPFVWLLILCAPPLGVVLLLCLAPRKADNGGAIRSGNPLLKPGTLPEHHDAVLSPLLHLTRTHSDADLRALILGLRHMPLKDTAFILRRYQHSADPELQLYSQSILQEKQEHLQHTFAKLLPRATPQEPAILASFIEAGLNLADSPLTPDSEQAAILRKALPKADLVLTTSIVHPRTVAAAVRYYVRIHEIRQAESLLPRLPAGSPLLESMSALVKHQKAILHPPPPLTSRYKIQ